MIAGLLSPDEGELSIFGVDARQDPIAAKRITAWLPDEPMLYGKLDPMNIWNSSQVYGAWSLRRRCAARESFSKFWRCGRIAIRAARVSRAA
jgi:ABC-2 type transport system ATP-binding protein